LSRKERTDIIKPLLDKMPAKGKNLKGAAASAVIPERKSKYGRNRRA
jgi:hypothetical protein